MTPVLRLSYKIGNNPKRDLQDADAYHALVMIARLFVADGRELHRKPGEAIIAKSSNGQDVVYSTNMYVDATPVAGLKIHVKPGDCGCTFKRFAGTSS
jgi:hypothetical protein